MKRVIYFLLIFSTMGFTVVTHNKPKTSALVSLSKRQGNTVTRSNGFIEVSSPVSYTVYYPNTN